MKSTVLLALAAVALAVGGWVAASVSDVQNHLADAQQHVATLAYDDAQVSLDAAEASLGYARWLPGFGERAVDDIRTRKAGLLYWTRKYDVLVPEGADPVAAIEEGSADLQLVVANAAHRQGQLTGTDRATMIRALEESASSYLTVLKNSEFREDAAFNYEYIIRLKEELARSRRPPPPSEEKADGDMGQSGAPAETTSQEGFEIYIPLESQERPAGGDAGKAPEKGRKG
jgi:hypothetical protein